MSRLRILRLTRRENGARAETDALWVDLPASQADGTRQLSLCDGLPVCAPAHADGLCAGKYKADLITEGLRAADLSVGDRLIFDHVILEITALGKRCFSDCPVRLRGERCGLPGRTAFARTVAPGTLRTGEAGEALRGFPPNIDEQGDAGGEGNADHGDDGQPLRQQR